MSCVYLIFFVFIMCQSFRRSLLMKEGQKKMA